MKNLYPVSKKIQFVILLLFLTQTFVFGQSFTSSKLKGISILNPTSLQFGPDGKLYVSQQDGIIKIFTIVRNDSKNYTATATEEINLIKNIPNHNDDGAIFNQPSPKRQVTSIWVDGTEQNPIIYVTSSDYRMGAATEGDVNLCTNSGILSKLYKEGGTWKKIDLVRGLPRSEENHSNNGMYLYNGKMLMAIGGFTNAGAPSLTFTYSCEFALSAAVLSIDLNAVEAMSVKQDPTGQHPYKYDIPTLDDPTRTNNPDGSDVNDPWGGNDGLNQTKIIPGGPVQVFASGFRNPYDIIITQHPARKGKIFSIDNGPNKNWGGWTVAETDGSYTNKYPAGEPGSSQVGNFDGLELIGQIDTYTPGSYYAGHPCPIRANPQNAGLYTSIGKNRGWRNNNSDPNLPLPSDWPPVPVSMADPKQGKFYSAGTPDDKSLLYFTSSTNGFCEYLYSQNALYGDLLAASFDGNIMRIKMNDAGEVLNTKTDTRVNQDKPFASGFGDKPLDIIAQADGKIFAGTVWVAVYGGNSINVFEPQEVACSGNTTSTTLDDDGDGFSNFEESQSGTDPCNAADSPTDTDNDGISDFTDDDDDNDQIKDNKDFYAIDAQNGMSTNIPTHYNLFNNDPGTGFFGLGFTGLMCNGVSDYKDLYDNDKIIAGGAVGALTVEEIPAGDATGTQNQQMYGFQFGVNVSKTTGPFVIHAAILPNYFDGVQPDAFQSQGIYFGNGDQDNYVKIVLNSNGGAGGIQVLQETDGATQSFQKDLPAGGMPSESISFYFAVDPATGEIFPKYQIGEDIYSFDPITVSGKTLGAIQKTDTALAIGLIATSNGSANKFSATWDYFEVFPGNITSIDQWHDGTLMRNINLYPNPSDDFVSLNINEENSQNFTLKIFNNLSQLIDERPVEFVPGTDDYKIQVENFPEGIYYFQLISEGQEHSATIKFIKK